MREKTKRTSTSVDLSGLDRLKIEFLVKHDVYTHFSDGLRDIIRRGTREVLRENGFAYAWESEKELSLVEED